MAMRVAGFAFGGRPENRGNVIVAFDVGFLCEIEVTTVRLAFTGKGRFQVFERLRVFQGGHVILLTGRAVVPSAGGCIRLILSRWVLRKATLFRIGSKIVMGVGTKLFPILL